MRKHPPLESPESSSPVVTRSVAAGLRGQHCQVYQFSALQAAGLRLVARLPQSAARFLVARAVSMTAISPQRLANFNIRTLIDERLRDYQLNVGRFRNITIGAALGGASAHLSLALDGPFLPQAFVTTLKGGASDGDINAYFNRSAGLAGEIARHNPAVQVTQHFDPVHDEWLTRRVNHLRFKLIDLPPGYGEFILNHLEPGGSITFLDCQARWLRYRIGPRHVFQVGGWGDLTPEEFIDGSPRLQHYCQAIGLRQCAWQLAGFPLESGPESEWGVEPGLDLALQEFCLKHGFRFVRIQMPEPHDYSRLAFRAIRTLLERAGRQPAGALVEMFSQFDALAPLESGLLPVWLVFNTQDSLRFLSEMIPLFPTGRPIFFSALSTFTNTPDLVPWDDWAAAFGKQEWINIGTRPTHYPADALALSRWAQPLRAWIDQNRRPISVRLTAEELLELSVKNQFQTA